MGWGRAGAVHARGRGVTRRRRSTTAAHRGLTARAPRRARRRGWASVPAPTALLDALLVLGCVGRWHRGVGRSAGRAGAPPARARRVRPATPPTSLPRCATTSRCPGPCALCPSPPAPATALTRHRSPLPGCPGCAAHLAGGERARGAGGRRGAEVRAQFVRVHRALVRADEPSSALVSSRRLPRRIVPWEPFHDTSRSPWRPACSRSPRPRTPPPPAPLRPARPDQRRCPQRQPQTGASSSAPGCATRFKTR
eukprot:COSAG04_NODE_962_length_9154_cov_68.379680_5_plen_253_part_00